MNKLGGFIQSIRSIRLNKRGKIVVTIFFVQIILIIIGIVFLVLSMSSDDTSQVSASDITGNDLTEDDFTYTTPIPTSGISITPTYAPEPVVDEEVTGFVPAAEMDLEPSSITVYVNKEHALPKNYKPENLITPNIRFDLLTYDERTLLRSEAAKAIERLFSAAEKEGYLLYGVSGYRSYARQYKIFTNNILTQGKTHTLQYSAVPGTSEHQTGLSMDVSTKSLNYKLTDAFADTSEGIWLAENAYKYGFIIRYPKDKADITGYAYEPWHIRYVGRGLSYYLYNNEMTLDEYYHYTPSKDFDFEQMYYDLINITPSPTVTVTPSATPTVTVTITPEAISDTPKKKKDKTPKDDTDTNGNISPVPTPLASPIPTVSPTITEDPSDLNPGALDENSTDNFDSNNGTIDILIE